MPPPRYSGVQRRPRPGPPAGGPTGVERVGAELELDLERRDERGDPVRRPARLATGNDHEVAVRAVRDAERDVDVERDRRRWRRAGAWRAASAARRGLDRDVNGPAPLRSTARQPSGVRRRFSTSSTSVPFAGGWPAWPVVRNTATRVIAWPRNAAPMPPVSSVAQPPTRPISSASTNMYWSRPGAPRRVASAYITAGPRIARLAPCRRASVPASAHRK